MVADPFGYDPVPFKSAGKMKVRYKMSECDNTANAGEARCSYCGKRLSSHISGCPLDKRPPETTTQNINLNLTIKLDAPILEHGFRVFNGLLRKINERVQGMPTAAEFSQLIGDVKTIIDTDRTALATKDADIAAKAARIAELEAQIAAGGMTAAEEQAVFNELMALKNPPTP